MIVRNQCLVVPEWIQASTSSGTSDCRLRPCTASLLYSFIVFFNQSKRCAMNLLFFFKKILSSGVLYIREENFFKQEWMRKVGTSMAVALAN